MTKIWKLWYVTERLIIVEVHSYIISITDIISIPIDIIIFGDSIDIQGLYPRLTITEDHQFGIIIMIETTIGEIDISLRIQDMVVDCDQIIGQTIMRKQEERQADILAVVIGDKENGEIFNSLHYFFLIQIPRNPINL